MFFLKKIANEKTAGQIRQFFKKTGIFTVNRIGDSDMKTVFNVWV